MGGIARPYLAWREANPIVVFGIGPTYFAIGCLVSGKDGPKAFRPGFHPGCPTFTLWKANKPELVLHQCDQRLPGNVFLGRAVANAPCS